jgi:hypothetical protein
VQIPLEHAVAAYHAAIRDGSDEQRLLRSSSAGAALVDT